MSSKRGGWWRAWSVVAVVGLAGCPFSPPGGGDDDDSAAPSSSSSGPAASSGASSSSSRGSSSASSGRSSSSTAARTSSSGPAPSSSAAGSSSAGTESSSSAGDSSGTGSSSVESASSGVVSSSSSAYTPACGNGVVDPGEACDDGNVSPGDGCALCAQEAGFQCHGAPSTCASTCGDGVRASNEACDDGNHAPNDGCDASCHVELGFGCAGDAPSVCHPLCGDGLLRGGEPCDDGWIDAGDGCAPGCTVEEGFTCHGEPSICLSTCGDGIVVGTEGCDDGNLEDGDGCSSACVVTGGWECVGEPSLCGPVCGDGLVLGTEQCDDLNLDPGDGCGADCKEEFGFTCINTPSVCVASCGDGLHASSEGCDDGNGATGDGCDDLCMVELGFTCTGEQPSSCVTSCGDGITAGAEQCDDSNDVNGDGCRACVLEHGYTCAGSPSVCGTTCGDGQVAGLEQCDDKNALPGDGCAACAKEAGWDCSGEPTVCTAVCGDGRVVGPEQCDDANALPGDGCAACVKEAGWVCAGAPSECHSVCEDGLVVGLEQCDDGNGFPGDGCVACVQAAGWVCAGEPSVCHTVCGDGTRAGTEECDDGNLQALDGCSVVCRVDTFTETEPNDTAATANGPFSGDVIVRARVVPRADVDVFAYTVNAITDLRVETFDGRGPGGCLNIDTTVELLAADGATVLAKDDDGGLELCSLVRFPRLSPGTYFIRVVSTGGWETIPAYALVVTAEATCGNGTREGSEECDGTAACTATCERVPTCGDNLVDAPETCDDGNGQSGDGCSSACQLEVLAETEPNQTPVLASGPFPSFALLGGAISPATDVDVFSIRLDTTADLRLETSDLNGLGSCVGMDTMLTLSGVDGTTVLARADQGGVGNCSLLDPARANGAGARHLPAGTYFVTVQSFLGHAEIPGYRLWVSTTARCGDGVVQGFEECDGSAGCSATCDRVPTCGDGRVDDPETCDDGNTANGDGCNATCALERVDAVEPNDTPATAQFVGSPHLYLHGAINPSTDLDLFVVQVPTVMDLRLEIFEGGAPGACPTMDPVVTLLAADGTTVLATADEGGLGHCSLLEGAKMQHLAPGNYVVQVSDFSGKNVIPEYLLEVRATAVCGNGVQEGAEECDGSANCDASCNRIPTCGDGLVDDPEQCDDGNVAAGDGCSATCALEAQAEVEPNDTAAQADAAALVLTGTGWVAGAVGAVGDKDTYRVDLAQAAVVHAETLGSVNGCSFATTLRLLDAGGTQLYADDTSGMGNCSALVLPLAAGRYYLSVEERGNDATVAAYWLHLAVLPAGAAETEPNEFPASATALPGGEVVALGGHQDGLDTDFFAVTVAAGHSLRAEVVEGGAETCESEGMDSLVKLYDSTGRELVRDDDSGRGRCSLLDGLGDGPAVPAAHALAGGTYFLSVEAAPWAQDAGSTAGQFDYRLVVTVR